MEPDQANARPEDSSFNEGEFFVSEMFAKADPKTEGDKRFIYSVASDENDIDLDNERVFRKALEESAAYFLKRGNCDLNHITKIGHRVGINNPDSYEIGIPVDVGFRDSKTFVKTQIFKGDGVSASNANFFWASVTQQDPPQRWFPSVAGKVLASEKSMGKDGRIVKSITRVLWNNLAFAKEPVNQMVPMVSLEPLTKSLTLFTMEKGMTAGAHETDAANLTGGAAARKESLDADVKTQTFRIRAYRKAIEAGRAQCSKVGHMEEFYKDTLGFSADDAKKHSANDWDLLKRKASKK